MGGVKGTWGTVAFHITWGTVDGTFFYKNYKRTALVTMKEKSKDHRRIGEEVLAHYIPQGLFAPPCLLSFSSVVMEFLVHLLVAQNKGIFAGLHASDTAMGHFWPIACKKQCPKAVFKTLLKTLYTCSLLSSSSFLPQSLFLSPSCT